MRLLMFFAFQRHFDAAYAFTLMMPRLPIFYAAIRAYCCVAADAADIFARFVSSLPLIATTMGRRLLRLYRCR